MKDPRASARVVRAEAARLGFDAVAIARADVPLTTDLEHLAAFVAAGFEGEMTWLAHHAAAAARLDSPSILEGAKSIVSVARRYRLQGDPPEGTLAGGIARYARGQDYHNFLRKRLRRLAEFIRRIDPDGAVRARPILDEEPVLERAWGARAGLGFIGKNGLLIVPGKGSFVLLGEVVTTLLLTPDTPIEGRCGSCTLCLDACPTGAFVRPFVLDPRRCIAYLTIESREPFPDELREGVGDHLFGCDDCQTVCPFNASPNSRVTEPTSARPFGTLERYATRGLAELVEPSFDEASFREFTRGSPLTRATRDGLARNAAIVLGNRRDAAARPALERAVSSHEATVVRDAAAWALRRLPPHTPEKP